MRPLAIVLAALLVSAASYGQIVTPVSSAAERWHAIRSDGGLGARASDDLAMTRNLYFHSGSSSVTNLVTGNNWSASSGYRSEFFLTDQPSPQPADRIRLTADAAAAVRWLGDPGDPLYWSGGYSTVNAIFNVTTPVMYDLSGIVRLTVQSLGEGSVLRDGSARFTLMQNSFGIPVASAMVFADNPGEMPVAMSGVLDPGRYTMTLTCSGTLSGPELGTNEQLAEHGEAVITFRAVPAPGTLACGVIAMGVLVRRRLRPAARGCGGPPGGISGVPAASGSTGRCTR